MSASCPPAWFLAPCLGWLGGVSSLGLWVLVSLLVVSVLGGWLVERERRRLVRDRFREREPIPVERTWEAHYPECDRAAFLDLWRKIAREVEVDPLLLRPSDRFDRDLKSPKGFPRVDEFAGLDDLLPAHRWREIDDGPRQLETVDDLVREHFGLEWPRREHGEEDPREP